MTTLRSVIRHTADDFRVAALIGALGGLHHPHAWKPAYNPAKKNGRLSMFLFVFFALSANAEVVSVCIFHLRKCATEFCEILYWEFH
jgi:hypothetical protein